MSANLRRDMQEWWDALSAEPARLREYYSEFEAEFWPLYERCKDFTMTTIERLYDLHKAVDYVSRAGVPGAIVECGVWCGGSIMMAALTLLQRQDQRPIYLFDTFTGMPAPGSQDFDLHGDHADVQWHETWARAGEEEVRANLLSTGYPAESFHLVRGLVEETLPRGAPETVALARLDTDFYDSTRVELEALWPRLSSGGVLIIDDYGHWLGARRATDEYFAEKPVRLVRIDYTCRAIQK
jgi:O-methyltransferase